MNFTAIIYSTARQNLSKYDTRTHDTSYRTRMSSTAQS